jgi:3-oxoacyl-[acyl-carrier-protein] synthase-3
MTRSYVKGLATYVPPRVVKNQDLEDLMTTSDEWIRQRTGIEERHYADEGVWTSDLGVEAARRAIADAGIQLTDVDMILFATLSPDRHFPGTGCYMQAKLGLPGVATMDIRNQCTGFLYGLATADAFVRTGRYKNVLLVGAEVHSSALDFTTQGRAVTVLFGDGAGAVVISPTEEDRGLMTSNLHADGRGAEDLCLHVWDISRKPYMRTEDLAAGEQWPRMNGRAVFKEATTGMRAAILEALDSVGKKPEDIDLLVPHQANLRINQWVASELGLPDEKVVNNIQRYGNTTAASIPIALAEARADGRLKSGMLVCIAAFGAGFTWGAALMRW